MCVDNGRPDTSLADKSLTDFVQLRTTLLKIVNAITSWPVCIPHVIISSPCGQLSAARRDSTIRQCKNTVTVLVSKKRKVL
jgi:hypothetical protein